MTTVASLTIEMAANVARLQADMARAANTVQSATAKMQKAAETAGRALGAIGAGLTVAAFTGFIRGAINAADETSKLSQKIGVTVKDVAGLQLAFRQAGVSQEAMATGLARLSKGIAEGNDGLKSLGIATKNNDGTLKTSRQVLAEVADQFAKTGVGATKTARAQEIFGKTGADLIPLLNAGSKALDEYDALASKLGLTLSDETAKQAENFNDTLDLVGQGVQGVGRQIAGQLLPTLTGLASEFFNTVSSGDNLKKTADFLAAALKGLYSAGVIGVEIFSSLGKTLGGVVAAVVAAVSGNFKQAGTIIGDLQSDVGTGWKEALAQVDRAWNTTGDNTVANLAQINKAQMTSTKSLEDGKKTAQEYLKLTQQLDETLASMEMQASQGRNLTAGQKLELDLIGKIDAGLLKLTLSQKLQVDGKLQQILAYEKEAKVIKEAQAAYARSVEFDEERNQAYVSDSRAREQGRQSVIDYTKAIDEQIALTQIELGQFGQTQLARNTALAQYRIELELKKQIDAIDRNSGFDEAQREEQRATARAAAARASANAVTQIYLDESQRLFQDIERGLTDSLFRAFEAGKGFFSTLWDGIKNLFKTTVLKAIIQPVVGGITGALGLTGAANAATTGGGIGNLLNIGSNLSTAYSALTGSFVTSIGSAATAAGNLFGSTAIAEFGLGLQGLALPSSTGALAAGGSAASALSSAAAAGPYVLAAVAALNALGVFRSNKIVDGGISGTLGGQVNDYALNRRGGTLFSGPDYSVRDLGVSAQNQALQDAYSAIRNTVSGMAEQLGIGNDAIKAFTVQLGNDLIHPDTGGFGIKTQGLSQDEILKKIEAALLSANEQLAAFALGTTEFTRDGETAVQTLGRLSGSLGSVNSVFKTLGLTLADASLAGADAASKFVDSFGGAEQFAQVASSYYQNFYTEAERTANTVEALRQRFFELGTAGATTREEFRALIEEQQRLNGATSPVVAELLKLSETFASVVPAAASAADAIAEASRAFGLINTNSGLRAATEAEATAAADRRDLIAGRRAAEQIRAAEQQEAAQAAATQAAQDRAEAEQALRRAYDAEIRALDEVIAKRDQAVQALESAFQRESDALQQTIDKFGDLALTLRRFVSDLNGIADTPEQSTARLRARFNATIAAALGGDADAARNIPGAGRDYVDAASLTAETRVDLLREIARVQVSTEGVIDFAEAQKTIAEKQLDALNQQVNGLLTVDQSVLSVSEAIAALQQANEAAAQAESQKAILTAQISSLITVNESVLSVRDAIMALDSTQKKIAGVAMASSVGTFDGSDGGGFSGGGGVTAAGAFGADNIVAQAGNFVVAKDARGNLVFANVDSAGILQTSTGIDNESVARLLVQSGQDRETLNQSLLGLAAQLDASGAAYLPGSVFAGSDFGVDFRDLANGGFGGNNFTLDANAALKGPTGLGTLQANQQIAAALGIANANRELIDSYRDLSFLEEGLGTGPGGTSPITTDELAQYRIPGFASGGEHAGGWRMVGEAGRELEYTPPSRIFSNSQTNALMDNSGVEKRLEQLEKTLMVGMATVAKNTADTTRMLEIWNGDGLPEEREVAA